MFYLLIVLVMYKKLVLCIYYQMLNLVNLYILTFLFPFSLYRILYHRYFINKVKKKHIFTSLHIFYINGEAPIPSGIPTKYQTIIITIHITNAEIEYGNKYFNELNSPIPFLS